MTLEAARASSEGPRFDLRFERGRAQLRLGRPLVGPGFTIEHLVTALDFRGPVDLRGGAKRFRHHRSRVVEARVRVHPTRLAGALDDGRVLRVDEARAGRLRLAFRDEAGVLAVDGALAFDGPDLLLQPRELTWVRSSPRDTWERWSRLAGALGGRAEPTTSAIRCARPLQRLLAEAMLPFGWRVPDERACGLRLVEDGDALVIEGAERVVGVRLPGVAAPSFDAPEPPGAAGELRASLDAGDLDRARIAYARLTGWLAGEAALAIAERFEHALTPDELAEWLVRGLTAFPHDERAWRRWTSRLAERGAAGALRLADAALAGPLSRVSRAELAVLAALGVLDGFGDPSWSDDVSDAALDRRVRRIVAEASALAPERPRVLASRAALAHREGSLAEASKLWERAADALATDDRATAAEWRRRAGQLALGLEGPAAAEPILRRALEESDDAPEVLCELASVLVERGDTAAAEELYARLLRPGSSSGALRRAALLAAARHHLERGAPDRARPFLAEVGDDSVSIELYDPPARSFESPDEREPAEQSVILFAPPETSQIVSPGGDALEDELDDELDPLDDEELLDELFAESRPRHLRAVDDEGSELVVSPSTSRDAPRNGNAAHLDSWLPGAGVRPPAKEPPVPPLPPPRRPPSAHPVTLVSVADDELRALLEAVAESDDPGGLLEGALEEALEDADAAGVRRVLRVLQRVDDFAGAAALAARARRLLDRLDEEP